MKVILEGSCFVQPAEPTYNGRMPLSESDQIGFLTHVTAVYFYKNPKTPQKDTIFNTLKTSLSKVLVHFHPFAGRLTWLDGSRLELDCNRKGAQLIEASSDAKLDDDVLGDISTSPDLHDLIPQINYKDPIEEIPLFLVQLTKFSCDGLFAMGFAFSHALADGQCMYQFVHEWARMARGEPLGTPPLLDRKVLRAGDPPPPHPRAQPHFQHDLYAPPPQLIGHSSKGNDKETTIAMLKLSKFQIQILKKEANNSRPSDQIGGRVYSQYESIAGHIWRCACKARGHEHEQPTSMGICVDIRRRIQPVPVPGNYFGNAIDYVVASGLSGDLGTRPLGYAASKIQQVTDKVTSQYVHSSIDFVKNLKDLSRLQDIHAKRSDQHWAFYGNPNIGVISWIGLPVHGLNFGWGNEILMAPVMSDGDGDSIILPSCDGDGSVVVALCLQSAYMEDFKKFFYQISSNL